MIYGSFFLDNLKMFYIKDFMVTLIIRGTYMYVYYQWRLLSFILLKNIFNKLL